MSAEEMIAVLEMVTRFSYEYLHSLSKEELERLYWERCEK